MRYLIFIIAFIPFIIGIIIESIMLGLRAGIEFAEKVGEKRA